MRALAHPTRVRMLHLLRTETLSASELGRRLRIRFGSAQYHLRTLERAGIARRVESGTSAAASRCCSKFRTPSGWTTTRKLPSA